MKANLVSRRSPCVAQLRAASWALRGLFFALGLACGSWGVHVPSAKAHYRLGEGGLAIALWMAALGAMLGLLVAGRVVGRWGARRAASVGVLAAAGALGALLLPSSQPALSTLLLLFGAGTALLDVAINADASRLEAKGDRKVMSGFHGMFSIGGMAAAVAGAALLRAEVQAATQLLAAGLLVGGLGLAAGCLMLPDEVGRTDAPAPPTTAATVSTRVRRVLLALGLLGAIGLVAEGALYDWSVLYVRQELAAPPAVAALAFASFSAAMAVTRFAGDWLRSHLSNGHLLMASGLLAGTAMAMVLLSHDPVVALIGFALVGVGLANVVPILYIAASQTPGVAPALAIARVSAIGYLGFMGGPPLIGGVTHATSLRVGLSAVVVCAGLLCFGVRWLPPERAT